MLQMQETLETGLQFTYEVEEVLHSRKTAFQTVSVLRTKPFGNALIIDGLMQSADCDERVYHECLVHPALALHPCPRAVYIAGAGEGSTAREVLKHRTVETCVMVDIDGDVVDFCKNVLPQNTAAFADPRLTLIIDDARTRLVDSPATYDVIILDLDDPLEGGPCYQLYTKEFYELCKAKLNPGGILVTQSSSAGVKNHGLVFAPVHNTLRHVFPHVHPYAQHVYSFADTWGFNMAFRDEGMALVDAETFDARLLERGVTELFFMDGVAFGGIRALPKFLRQALAAETRLLTHGQYAAFFSAVAPLAQGGAGGGAASSPTP